LGFTPDALVFLRRLYQKKRFRGREGIEKSDFMHTEGIKGENFLKRRRLL